MFKKCVVSLPCNLSKLKFYPAPTLTLINICLYKYSTSSAFGNISSGTILNKTINIFRLVSDCI